MHSKLARAWAKTCMSFAGRGVLGRAFAAVAGLGQPPYKGRRHLARLTRRGYVAPGAQVHGNAIHTGQNVFIGDGVVLYQGPGGGAIQIGDRSTVHRHSILETGEGGSIQIGSDSHLQARCQLSAYKGSITIGNAVQVAPGCAFYPYDHGTAADIPIRDQPLRSRGGIVVGDDAWLGFGVVLLDGANVGAGAVIGAGSIVKHAIPIMAIAVGSPARVVGYREPTGATAGGSARAERAAEHTR